MINLPSLSYLNTFALKAAMRFPLALLSAIVAASTGNYLIENESRLSNAFPVINMMLTAALGVSLFFCISIFNEKKKIPSPFNIVNQVLGIIFLGWVYFSLPDGSSTESIAMPYYRFAIFSVIIHLLASFAPYLKNIHTLAFWNYNKILFLRLLTALFYSAVLYLGILLAMTALHLLFEVKFDQALYLQLFVLIIGIFNTWFFLAGIPSNLNLIDKEVNYPKGLKIFSQYILLSLLLLYLLILYGYSFKIIMAWDWPKGIVSYLIIGVATWGILTVLLLYPFRDDEKDRWIGHFSRLYYFLLFPLVVVLFTAIGIRISEYGITINRYLIVLLGVWLALTCFYFKLGFKSIKFIPLSLASILLFSSFGPWGIFSVSERSQTRRLKALLRDSHLLEEDRATQEVNWDTSKLPDLRPEKKTNTPKQIDNKQIKEIYSITRYLENHHGLEAMKTWFSQDLEQILQAINKDKSKWNKTAPSTLYLETLGLPETPSSLSQQLITLQADQRTNPSITIRGYDYLNPIQITDQDTTTFIAGLSNYSVQLNAQKNGLAISSPNHSANVDLSPLVRELIKTQKDASSPPPLLPASDLTYSTDTDGLKIKITINHLSFTTENDSSLTLSYLDGNLLLRDSLIQRK
ncbi:hypothetical protein DN752_15475 [Echinicola strongylocentroti]|uniref:DUF4153 domain-containing protein n=1 Tax=Echinicola strongylocentroti TaxID=1795355 RepID=A0A2Z4IKZ9_9BACT|nr:DUF4153 domain-containing protein [Echinicola strongylocentroti]AWW31409.1 hypothetical protein DN752_15475 [Echinicola strongylocentroti]